MGFGVEGVELRRDVGLGADEERLGIRVVLVLIVNGGEN